MERTVSVADRSLRVRFWLELVCGALGAILFVVTLITREWIELIFGVDPDNGSGTLEFAIAFGLLAVSIVSGLLAVRELRRTQPT
jgi:uncharacterized membrane protein HdeD (DUF308 family)